MNGTEGIAMIPAKAVVIYHKNCMDGLGAAWAFHKIAAQRFDDVKYIPKGYNDDPWEGLTSNPISTLLFILDFSFPPHIFDQLAKNFKRVVFIDHHKTAIESYENYAFPQNAVVVLNKEKSGALLTFEWLLETYDLIPGVDYVREEWLIKRISDRDTWKFAFPDTKQYHATLSSAVDFTNSIYAQFIALNYVNSLGQDTIVSMGNAILNTHNNHIKSIIQTTKRRINIAGREGLVCNCNGMFASDVGNELAKESLTFGATYYHAEDGSVKFSLRSIDTYDVSEIAKLFGGGGHRNAAGFSLADPTMQDEKGITLWQVNPST